MTCIVFCATISIINLLLETIMSNFFFEHEHYFIEAVRKLIPEEILVEPHFDFKIAPLCRQQYFEEAKLKEALSDNFDVRRFIDNQFSYDLLWTSTDFASDDSMNKLLSEFYFKIQWYDNSQNVGIFDFRQRDKFEYNNIPSTQTKEGKIFNAFIYNRMKYIVENFKSVFADKIDYLVKLDLILSVIDHNNIFNLEDSFLLDKKQTKKEINNTLLHQLDIAFLMNDTTDEKTINMLKTKVDNLSKENLKKTVNHDYLNWI